MMCSRSFKSWFY